MFLSIENVKHESEKEEPSTSVLQPLSESATSTSAQPVFWNDEATKLLIAEMRAREEKSNSWKITKKNVYWNYRENEQRMIYLYMEAGAGEVEDIGNGVEENKRS